MGNFIAAGSGRGISLSERPTQKGFAMIVLTKMNFEKFLVNHFQIECIEVIPETKIVMMNHDYYIVRESTDEIIDKITEYNAKVLDIHRKLTINDRR